MSDFAERIAAALQPVLGIPVFAESDAMAAELPTCATVALQPSGHMRVSLWHAEGGDALFDMAGDMRKRLTYARPLDLGFGITFENLVPFEHRILRGEADYADRNELDVAYDIHNKPQLSQMAKATQDRQSQR